MTTATDKHSDLFTSMVKEIVKAEQDLGKAHKSLEQSQDGLRRALEKMESRLRRILEQGGTDPATGYEVVFLDDALHEINEADHRHQIDVVTRNECQLRRDLLKRVVDALKPE
jgi:hypothetical protein